MMNEIEAIVQEEFGVVPSMSRLRRYTKITWDSFSRHNNLHPLSRGIYALKTMTAHVDGDNILEPMGSIHEYFGHGIFTEQSVYGQSLLNAECFGIDMKNNYLCDVLESQAEGFAIWMEGFVANAMDDKTLKEKFELSLESYHPSLQDSYEQARKASFHGELCFKREYGFPMVPTVDNVKEMLATIHNVRDYRFAVLYGSKKSTSDVDIFIVGDGVKTYKNDWLDIYAMSSEEFDGRLDAMLIDVTDPLFTGDIVFGKEEVENLKRKVLEQPITDDMIKENLAASMRERYVIDKGFLDGKELHNARGYMSSFRTNALYLSQGKKMLTKTGGNDNA